MKKIVHKTKPQEKITDYFIGGWFGVPSVDPKPVVFWGRFKLNEIFLRDSKIDGELLDRYGSSKIKGVMNDRGLEFEKRYSGRNDVSEYNFEKRNGIWVGEYTRPKGEQYPAIAFTNLVDKSLFEAIGNKLAGEDYFLHPLSF